MTGSNCRLILSSGAFVILTSLFSATHLLNSIRKTPQALNHHYHSSLKAVDNRGETKEEHFQMPGIQQTTRIPIPLNTNSTIVSDVPDIWHDPEKQAICVALKEDARCPHPAFLGRLSGPALALLEWHNESTELNSDHVQCGSYKHQWLEAGTYFLDIITLFCDDFGVNSATRTLNESAWLSYNFQNDCMEDPNNNRITGVKAYITIEKSISNTATTQHHQLRHNNGRWISNTTDPLYTRYQPKRCRRNPEKIERCYVPMNDTMLKSYSFEWENNVGEKWSQKLRIAAKMSRQNKIDLPKICLVGFSHSRFLKKSFGAIGLGNYVDHIQARYPSDVSEWLFDHYYTNHSCTNFVVGVAQWPGSLMQGSPYLFDRFYLEMKRIANAAATTFADKKDNVKVYMRSVHQIPIGDVTGACPMGDWRSPLVMDGYTHVMQKAVEEVQKNNGTHVEFLDTQFIVSPMWDNAFDWIHLAPQVSDVEALYMASIIYDNILNDQTKNGSPTTN